MARFIRENDYEVQMRGEISQVIDETTERSKLMKAEDFAISQMKNHLSGRCDLAEVFKPQTEGEPDPRDPYVVMLAIDLALYHLWSKEGGNNMPENRALRYADALKWLIGVREGEPHNLPELTDETGENIDDIFIWSEHLPESNRY